MLSGKNIMDRDPMKTSFSRQFCFGNHVSLYKEKPYICQSFRLKYKEKRYTQESMDIKKALGRKITKLRKEKGLTKAEFARRVGVKWVTVNDWEQGKYMPNSEKLAKIAEILETPLHELFVEDTPEPEPFPGYNRVMAAGKHNQWDVLVDVAREHRSTFCFL